jgi:DeoD family purine-nucleoside phosphorylase
LVRRPSRQLAHPSAGPAAPSNLAEVSGTIHLHPTAELAPRVLVPGDPGRALLLAQALLGEPKIFNHHRGLWGYTGTSHDGRLLTIQSTGMGGPSAAIVVSELIELGARRIVRVGTCGAIDGSLALGELLVATGAIAADGTSRALGGPSPVPATGELLSHLREAAGTDAPAGLVVSTDLFYDPRPDVELSWRADGAVAVEMETATLFALAARHEVEAASLLIVSDVILPSRRRIPEDALRDAEHRLGEVAARALGLADLAEDATRSSSSR